MTSTQKIAAGLFTLSMLFFVLSLTLSRYELSPSSLEEGFKSQYGEVPQEKYDVFWQSASAMREKVYRTQFSFVPALKKVFRQSNERISSKYKITEEELNRLAALNTSSYNQATLEETFPRGSEASDYKNKKLKDYTGWMADREYSKPEEIKNDLANAVKNINAEVKSQKGFSEYDEKSLLFHITKDATQGLAVNQQWLLFGLTFGLGLLSALLYIFPIFQKGPPGIKHDHIFHSANTNRGYIGIAIGVFLIGFYVLLYWYAEYMTNWVIMVDPFANIFTGGEASQWFLYGFLYTLCILVMGIRMFAKYRHSRYQQIRTASVMFFQFTFAFFISNLLVKLNQPYMDLKNIWPLNYDFFTPGRLNTFVSSGQNGGIGYALIVWGIILAVIAVPVLVYFFGKRWYCSWVCGCGGLAETLGDPYRQLSDKRLVAWKIERWLIHGVLVFAVVMTGLALYTFFSGSSVVLGINTYTIKKVYGFLIASAFAGVVGTGFYPLMGNRVWCRFGCPLAAYLGLVQRFRSRFRITTNGGQCISCGNCSTYCEMGIDVRWYAQRGQNIVRSSCVGCGVCSSVCPRGVLNLENGPTKGRINADPILLGNDGARVAPVEKSKAEA